MQGDTLKEYLGRIIIIKTDPSMDNKTMPYIGKILEYDKDFIKLEYVRSPTVLSDQIREAVKKVEEGHNCREKLLAIKTVNSIRIINSIEEVINE